MSVINYLADGQRCCVLANLPSGKFLVAGLVGSADPEELWFDTDNPRVVDHVFTSVPYTVHENRVAELMAQVEKLEARCTTLDDAIVTTEHAHRERLERLAKYRPLELIEDFLEGRITHYVVSKSYYHEREGHYALRITTPQEQRSEEGNKWSKKLRLLALYGDPEKSLEWVLHHYSDGSGGNDSNVWPCTSLEAAQAKARELFDACCAIQLKRGDTERYADELKASAEKIGVPVPEWITAGVRASTLKYALRNQSEAQKALDLANAKLAALQA